MILDIIGYAGGFLVAVALAPQIIKTWRTKSTKDISLLWTLILLAGLVLATVYALINSIIPLIVFDSVEIVMTLMIIGFKIRFESKS